MPKSYRALISVPITARNDDQALALAEGYANSLMHPRSRAIAGHCELLAEVEEGQFAPLRVVFEDGALRQQLP